MEKNVIVKLEKFFKTYPTKEYKKGDVLIPAGLEPPGVFYIESGIVKNYSLSLEGSEVILNMFKPHAFFPMSWAIGNVRNAHFYEAMTSVKVRLAPKEAVLAFLQKEPDIVYDLLRRIYIGMEGLWSHLESLATGNSYTKLVASLVIIARRFGKQQENDITISLKFSERNIANYAGMSRETASRELQKLKKEKLVSFDKGTVVIHDMKKLENLLVPTN